MRMAPVGLLLEPEAAYEYGCRFSAITHGRPTGITADGAFAMLMAYLLAEKPLAAALALVEYHLQVQDGPPKLLRHSARPGAPGLPRNSAKAGLRKRRSPSASTVR